MFAIRRIGANSAFLLVLLTFVVCIAGVTAYTVQRLRSEAIAAHRDIGAMYAHVFEDHLTQTFRFVNLVLVQTLDAAPAQPQSQLEGAKISAQLANTLRQTPALRSLSLLDERGRIVASSNPGNLGVSVQVDDYLPPRSGRRNFFGIGSLWSGRDFANGMPAVAGQLGVRNTLPGFVPVIYDLQVGNRVVSLLAAVNPDYLVNNFGQKLSAEQGFTEILRYDGKILLSTDEQRPSGPVATSILNKLADVEAGGFDETLPDGTEVITAYRGSAQFPLLVVTRLYRDYALRKWAEERRLLLSIVLPSLLLVVVLASLLYRRERRIEIQRVEARRREHERLAATVFATVDAAVMVSDADNSIVEVNPAFTAVTGFAAEEVIGRKPNILSSGKHPPEFFRKMYQTLAETGAWHGEIWNRHKNGNNYIEWLSIKQVRDEKGVLTHHVAAFSDITDRKQAEEAQLRSILEASPEAVLLVDDAGAICFANQVAERVFAYSRRELIGLAIESLVPAAGRDQHQHYRHNFSHCPRSRPMANGMRLTALCRDGREFPAEISLSPIRMGEHAFVIASVSDISQRIRDEEALRASEERWKFALEGAGEGVWDWNVATGETHFSQRIAEFLGHVDDIDDIDAAVESNIEAWVARIHPDDRGFFQAELQAHCDGKTATFAVEHRLLHKNGQWVWAHGRGMVVGRDAAGQPLRLIGTYADIGERKKIEADFHDLLQFNQAVIANSHSGIMVHKVSGECIMANEAAARISGGSVEHLLQHNFRASQSWCSAGATAAAVRALENGAAVEFESPMRTFFGRDMWCVASFGRLNIKGEFYLLTVFNDISARKNAENAVFKAKEDAEALLDRARMAERRIIDISEETRKRVGQELHDDLGQHLTGVAFLSEVLFQKLRNRQAGEMQDAAGITELINTAVSKTRHLAQGLYPVELQEAGLPALLGQTVRNVESIYGIRCELHCEGDPAIADFQTAINLFRIAQEAINNAIRHGNAKEIHLYLRRQDAAIYFEIADQGNGFDSSAVDANISGLGMHTMQYRAALVGASLQIVGTPGVGTRVVLHLPVE